MTKFIVILAFAFATLLLASSYQAWAVKASKESMANAPASDSLVVVELYTSQGCSSCPPADRVIAELATNYSDKVLPLSFHVDYWDYIGWKDPFSSGAHTNRQRSYSSTFGRSNVYTPQAVIGGKAEMVGSSRSKVLAEIARQLQAQEQGDAPAITLNKSSDEVVVDIAAGRGKATILAVEFQPEHTTKILRGENRGRTLTNYNIVTKVRPVGTWDGSAQTISLNNPASEGLAIVLQSEGVTPNTILSAARLR